MKTPLTGLGRIFISAVALSLKNHPILRGGFPAIFILFHFLSCSALVALLSCEVGVPPTVTEPTAQSGINEKTAETSIGGLTDDKSGNPCPYPEIVHQVFDPEDLYGMKSLVWRITWPDCYDRFDEIKIPTVLLPNGALYSIYFLNNASPQSTFNSIFSLYHDNKIKKTADMGDVLVNAVNPPEGSMESVTFGYNDDPPPIEFIQSVVENSPGGMVHFYLDAEAENEDEGNEIDELEYEEGDILFFKLSGPDYTRYGVIWIASMSPRIIDVYMTAKNNRPIDDIRITTKTPRDN